MSFSTPLQIWKIFTSSHDSLFGNGSNVYIVVFKTLGTLSSSAHLLYIVEALHLLEMAGNSNREPEKRGGEDQIIGQ